MRNDTGSSAKKCYPNLTYQYVAALTGILITACYGMHLGWTSPSLPLLLDQNSTIPTTSPDGSWMVLMPAIGQSFSSLIGVFAIDRIGRRTSILIGSPLLLIPWLIIAYARNVLTIECARFIAGFGGGLVCIALPIYIGEVANKNIRGLLGCSIQTSFKFGILMINMIGLNFDIRMTALISATLPILHFATFWWTPESPYFFILQRKNQRAAASLIKFTKTKDADAEITELSSMITGNVTRLDIFTKTANRNALGVILGLKTVELLSGSIVITFYCLIIFNEAGGAVAGSTATIIYLAVQVIVTSLSCALVDKIGRKPLLIVSILGAGCSLLVEGIYFYMKHTTTIEMSNFGFVPLLALLAYISSHSVGLATIPTLMMGEIFPVSVKSFAVGIVTSWIGVVSCVAAKLFQITKDEYGMHVPFFIFALSCIIGFIFVIYCVPETKGKTLEEIQLDWERTHSMSSQYVVVVEAI